jgi:large subunit ribosomal protein L31
MRKEIHPKYRKVCFLDVGADHKFVTGSTMDSKETIEIDGEEMPLIRIEISSASHPFFTGKQKFVDTAGRVEKFRRRYQRASKKED